MLLAQIALGDYTAFTSLYEKYVKSLTNYGLKFTTDLSIIEDCVHDLFVWLWTNKEKLSIHTSLEAYLIKSLRSSVLQKMKKQKTLRVVEEVDDYTFPLTISSEEQLIENQEGRMLKERLEKILSTLTPKQREVIYLRYYKGLSFEEIAENMQLSTKACYKLMGRAIAELRNALPLSGLFLLFFLK